MSSEPKALPPVQRHITTHDADGKAVWDTSLPVQVDGHRSGGFTLHQPWANTDDAPDHNGDRDLQSYHENLVQTDIAPESGSVVRVIDFWPGTPGIMHRTASVDYGVVLEGEVECILDGGALRTFRRGDIIIQRGTNHAWKNTSNEIARVFVTLLPTPPVKIQGKELEVHHLSDLGRLAEEQSV
ncbi:hypothetical protein B0J13DRAFT_24099 [Dactylonectria estremocensis]|uniref:Cupin type-2 domain-containing protein n=1 Tax=Dactylonectria estremocensis TaxID=1079267 RepID=A0A9P9FIL2_9HYPO|nr:hypothetical protein B0J13DRAFT_24099 [Dactylonectria estremocensis]